MWTINMNDDDNLRKIQSLTKQLEEKDRDILLSAQIGKELLDKNSKLEDRIYELQSELRASNENVEQLSYQLNQKNDLINILTNDEGCGSENGKYFVNQFETLPLIIVTCLKLYVDILRNCDSKLWGIF